MRRKGQYVMVDPANMKYPQAPSVVQEKHSPYFVTLSQWNLL